MDVTERDQFARPYLKDEPMVVKAYQSQRDMSNDKGFKEIANKFKHELDSMFPTKVEKNKSFLNQSIVSDQRKK